MKLPSLCATLLCALLSSCTTPGEPAAEAQTKEKEKPSAPAPAGNNGLAPRSIAGAKLSYRDLHSRNVFTFFPDGKFQFDYVHVSGRDTGSREGRYRYKVTSPDVAVIDCGDSEVITLRFDSPRTATGTIEGDVRPYRFTLTRP